MKKLYLTIILLINAACQDTGIVFDFCDEENDFKGDSIELIVNKEIDNIIFKGTLVSEIYNKDTLESGIYSLVWDYNDSLIKPMKFFSSPYIDIPLSSINNPRLEKKMQSVDTVNFNSNHSFKQCSESIFIENPLYFVERNYTDFDETYFLLTDSTYYLQMILKPNVSNTIIKTKKAKIKW